MKAFFKDWLNRKTTKMAIGAAVMAGLGVWQGTLKVDSLVDAIVALGGAAIVAYLASNKGE